MKIQIFINDFFIEDELYYQDKTLLFYFKNAESYKTFKESFSPTKKFLRHDNTTLCIKDLPNYDYLKKLFKKEKPTIIYQKYQADIFTIDFPVIIDLTGLTFQEKINILTDPNYDKNNLFFKDEYTVGEYLNLKDFINMYQTIFYDCEEITKRNYSPLEALYFVYFKYKERIYKDEKKRNKKYKSRSLNQIMKNDNIVCVGYANYLCAIASILNLNVYPLSWTNHNNPNRGHRECIAFVNDPKYNIQGIFTIDTTWDAKKDEEDTTYLTNIKHFLPPLKVTEAEKEKNNLVYPADEFYYPIFDKYAIFEKLYNFNAPEAICNKAKESVIKQINLVRKKLGISPISDNCDIDQELKNIKKMGKVFIPLTTLKKIIATVTPEQIPSLDETIASSYHYKLLYPEEKLLYAILKRTPNKELFKN